MLKESSAPALDAETNWSALQLDTLTAQPPRVSGGVRGRNILAVCAGLLLLALTVLWLWSPTTPAPTYHTVQVTRGDIQVLVTATGKLEPVEWVDVGAQVSGQLTALQVDVSDAVTAGDLLARIDAAVQNSRVRASQANLEVERAQLSAREAALSLAEAQLKRQQELNDQSMASEQDLERATNQLASAQSGMAELLARIARSEASLASDEAELNYSLIHAPMSGTVIAIEKTVGQTLNANQQVPRILRIADLSAMTVRAEVSEADIGKLQPGTEAYFMTLGGGQRRWQGRVEQVLPSPNVHNGVVLYPVLFRVDNADRALLPQMTAQVFFITDEVADAPMVPVNALTYPESVTGRAQVRVLTTNGVEPREITPGVNDRVNVQIVDGLSVGERVLLSAGLR